MHIYVRSLPCNTWEMWWVLLCSTLCNRLKLAETSKGTVDILIHFPWIISYFICFFRTWRGHYCRMRLPKKPPPPKLRPKPRELKPRFGADVLRRVWARSEFEPAGQSYLHNTDFGYLQYNIWEHTEDPPEGSDVGLLTRKVCRVFS